MPFWNRSTVSTSKQPERPVVFSWLAQVEWQEKARPRTSFEVLARHLLARLLQSMALGTDEDVSISQAAQLAYAAALPQLMFALYLFPAYHQPLAKPDFWAQASDHFFYVDVSFAISGLAAVLLWDGLFPDPLDALILTHLPLSTKRVLTARLLALMALLGGLLIGTALPGTLFFPGVADLAIPFPRSFLAHAVAVLLSGSSAVAAVFALRGAVVFCPNRGWARTISPLLQAGCVLCFTLMLLLEPIAAHLLPSLLPAPAWRWFPPFWFLGLYEHLLLGPEAPAALENLTRSGLLATASLAGAAVALYPAAHARRMRQISENMDAPRRAGSLSRVFGSLLQWALPWESRSRAVLHWISQTLPRTPRTRLLSALFAAFALAAPLAVCLLRFAPTATADAALSFRAARLAPPLAALLAVAGLRTVFRLPAAERGAWAFQVIHGRAKAAHLRGAEIWAAGGGVAAAALITLLVALALPHSLRAGWNVGEQAFTAALLAVLYAGSLFLREREIPFLEQRASSVNDLSIAVVGSFAVLPGLAFTSAAAEAWMEKSPFHIPTACAIAALVLGGLRQLRANIRRSAAALPDMEQEPLLPGEIGLRG